MYEALFGYHVFGLGFVTSMAFIIGTGVPLSMPNLGVVLPFVMFATFFHKVPCLFAARGGVACCVEIPCLCVLSYST